MFTIRFIIAHILFLLVLNTGIAQNIRVQGFTKDEQGNPVAGATIKTNNRQIATQADRLGHFFITMPSVPGQLQVTCTGYITQFIEIKAADSICVITLKRQEDLLDQVTVVTGYQSLPKERATGSFTNINNNLLNRSTGPNILARLEHVSSGLLFDKRFNGQPLISIRGISTIESDARPLIVVDNFPYEGDINSINPNDVESVTLLKDAAAASIWGTRAGNGVIVISTKKGSINRPLSVELNSNITIGQRPRLLYSPNFLNTPDFIEVERSLFGQGFYADMETSTAYPALSPVVTLLAAVRDGKTTTEEAERQIALYKNSDIRKDLQKYFYRNAVAQQYSLGLKGGSHNADYFLSAGVDRNNNERIRDAFNRVTLNSRISVNPIKNMELATGITYSSTKQINNTAVLNSLTGSAAKIYPYARLADNNGNPLPIIKDFNDDFVKNAENKGLLNWQFYPLKDLALTNNQGTVWDIRINNSLRYRLLPGLNAEARYQYYAQSLLYKDLQNEGLYSTRNLINQFAQADEAGTYSFPIPKGAILDLKNDKVISHAGRLQLNYDRTWNERHQLNMLAGIEVRQTRSTGNSSRIYGYNDDLLTYGSVDYKAIYTLNPSGSSTAIPTGLSLTDLVDRNRSFYLNSGYTYLNRYLLSGSIRKDASNLFGVAANQKGVPLWSAGLGWIINKENFYKTSSAIPYLKLRATYGDAGNVNKQYTAYTTGQYRSDNWVSQFNYLQLVTPPNPRLRWERVRTINLGLDFGFKNNTVSGSIDYYQKKSSDLIGRISLAPSAGFTSSGNNSFIGNSASMKSSGIDVQLNLYKKLGEWKWNAQLLYSYNRDKVIKYESGNYITDYFYNYSPAVPGRPRFSIYSIPWAGLDPQTGDPTVLIGGKPEKDYNLVFSTLRLEDLKYEGPGLPPHYGSLRNTIAWKKATIGFNISYKLGYYFRKSSINYTDLFNNWAGHKDFENRWIRTGDELRTNVPSIPAIGTGSNRDLLYTLSGILVEKGDHVRFQDINFSYELAGKSSRNLPFANAVLFGYINNIGFIWRANKEGLDPDFPVADYPPLRTYSLGLKITF